MSSKEVCCFVILILGSRKVCYHSNGCWIGIGGTGTGTTITNTNTCTDGTCTSTMTEETNTNGVTVINNNNSNNNNNSGGNGRRRRKRSVRKKSYRKLPPGFTLKQTKKLCFSLLTPQAKTIFKQSVRIGQINQNDLNSLTFNAFQQCDYNGDFGLSWDEIQHCKIQFCHMLTVTCPTRQNFIFYDIDHNGILTMEEYYRIQSRIFY